MLLTEEVKCFVGYGALVRSAAKIDENADNGYQSSIISEKGLFGGRPKYKTTDLVFWGERKDKKLRDTVTCLGRKTAYMHIIYASPYGWKI